ncbi:MAG: methyl-accepting chemotaxis protein [Burkholderiales bacterium]|nr:methyl-accepting chemotaxis protein [Burkholderiales bacterium]
MEKFRDLTIGARLGIGFGVLLLALGAVSVLGVSSTSRIGAMADRILSEDWRRSQAAHELERAARDSFVAALQSLQKTEQTPFTVIQARVAAARKNIDQAMALLVSLSRGDADRVQLGQIDADRKAYLAALTQVFELAESGKVVQGEAAVHRALEPSFAKLSNAVRALVEQNLAQAEAQGAQQLGAIATARATMVTLGVVAVILGALFAWWVSRSLTGPLAGALAVARDISSGRLDATIDARGSDEVGQLLRALADMQSGLRAMIGDVARSAGEVSSAATRFAGGAQESIARAQTRTEAAGATAASVEQMSVSIGQVAEHAQEAAAIAGRSSELAAEGEAIVRAAASEMNSIADSVQHSSRQVETLNRRSAQISSIIKVIKDIADQTNLLALNAAIEAARAGEQGRGFAVVADEVRKLAERTAAATSEIGGMIETILEETSSVVETMQAGGDKVGHGVTLAEEAAAALEKIKAQAMEAVASVNAIAAATREQQAASGDIARNVERIAQMAEEGGAAAAANADAARDLDAQAAALNTHVSRFTL